MTDTISMTTSLDDVVRGKIYSRVSRTFTRDLSFLGLLCLLPAEDGNLGQEPLTLGRTLEEACSQGSPSLPSAPASQLLVPGLLPFTQPH